MKNFWWPYREICLKVLVHVYYALSSFPKLGFEGKQTVLLFLFRMKLIRRNISESGCKNDYFIIKAWISFMGWSLLGWQ